MKHVESNKRIKLGALFSYLAIGFNILAGLIYTPWMVETIGQSDYGLFTLASSLISIFLLDFGISSAVTRFVSKYNAEKDQESINNFLGIICKLYLLIDIIIFIIMLICYYFIDDIYKQLTVYEITRFKVVYIIAALFNLASFPFVILNGIMVSYEEFVPMKVIDLLNKLFTVLTTVVILLTGGGLYALVTINAVWNLIAIVAKLIIIKKATPIKVNFKYKSKNMFKEIFGFSAWSTVISVSKRLIFNITPSILGIFSGSSSIAVFGIASTIEGYIFIFANAMNGMFLPKVTRIVVKDNGHKEILPLMIKVGRIQLSIIGLLIIGFFSIGRNFIVMWMGQKYVGAYYCSIALIVPSIFYLPQQIANATIVATNKVKYEAFVFIFMAFINVILSLIFTYFWNELGASISIFFAYMVRTIGMNFIYYKELHIDVFLFFKECHMKMVIPQIITLLIGVLINGVINISGWVGIIVKGMLISIVYIAIMWKFVWNKYEKDLITDTLKSIFLKLAFR